MRTGCAEIVSPPARTQAVAIATRVRESAAPTVSASAAPPGAPMLPKPTPELPSFPADATTSVPSLVAPSTARDSGLSVKAANGSTSGASATVAPSVTAPSPLGSTARSSPAISWSPRPVSAKLPSLLCCQPTTRIGTIFAPGATAATSPAIRVPCASTRPWPEGSASGTGFLSPPTTSKPRRRRLASADCFASTPVSSRATLVPWPSNPGRLTPAWAPTAGARKASASAGYTARTG